MDEENIKLLNKHQINNKILAKEPFVRADFDLLNHTGNYLDEDYQIYQEKCNKFFEIAKIFQRYNEKTFVTSKTKYQNDYENFVEENSGDLFDQEKEETESEFIKQFHHKISTYDENGRRGRKRLIRNIHEKLNTHTEDICIEPWFKKFLILNKFIHYSRAVILKHRLLKNLEKLKKLDKHQIAVHERKSSRCTNESYAQLFVKFL